MCKLRCEWTPRLLPQTPELRHATASVSQECEPQIYGCVSICVNVSAMRDSGQGCLCKSKHSQGLEFFSEPQVGKWKRSILWSQPGILNMCGPSAANKWLLSFGDLLASHKTSWGHSTFYSHPRKPWAEQTMGNTTAKHNKYEISQFLFIGSCVYLFPIFIWILFWLKNL